MTSARTSYRLALVVAVGSLLFLILSAGALGIIGYGREDRMYVAVPVVAVIGTVLARLRPRGMAVALAATALTPVVIAVIALARGLQNTEGASVTEILGLTGMFVVLFGTSAWLFWRTAELGSPASVPDRA